ncbi:helix-turn-helix domain-containing protein [Catellatospora sp. NPDC049111]|uniref:winged helix-turn-helix transcriptional regulator n=1 Tax=Catellatospora sp. NPDC049111 TaxID=3155271 RepID=UPI0033E92A78
MTSTSSAETAFQRAHANDSACRSFQPVLELVGRRWVGMVMLAGQRGARRFGQYRAYVDGISDRMLAQRLRELERHGLLAREVIPTTPVQILYAPTPRALELMGALQPLLDWTVRNPEAFMDAADLR